MISYDIYLFHYYSLAGLLNRLLDLGVEIKKYYVYNNDYYLKINRKYRKAIKENLKDYCIIDKIGVVNRIEQLFLKPITLISLLLSVALFINFSNKIYGINIKGDYPYIEEELLAFLTDNSISIFKGGVSHEKIKEVEAVMKEKFNDELEFIELIKEGATISLSYKKRRKNMVFDGKSGSLYATKDGVIKGFSLLSGVKNVRAYDFVRKGDLLVSDILVTTKNENIVVGTIGKVFASTFYYVEVRCKREDEAATQVCLLDKARNEVAKNLNSNDEYIESETILKNDLDNGYLKAYYVLHEDITI